MANEERGGYSRFDDTRWPVVVVTLPRVPLTPRAFDAHCQQISSYFERGQPFGLVVDAGNAPPLSPDQRRRVAELSDRFSAKYPRVKHVIAVVVASAVHRGIVKTITWLTQQPVPTAVVASVREGQAWVSKRLARTTVSELGDS